MAAATWTVGLNWTGEGSIPDFSDTGEDVSARVQTQPGIVTVRGRDTSRAFAPPAAGSASLMLDNDSRDYSPANASGPLYGKLLPGVRARIRANDGVTREVWQGEVDDLQQEVRHNTGFVRVPCLGLLARLRGRRVSTPLLTNVTTSYAIDYLLDAAGFGAAEFSILDTGKTTLTAWWCDDDDAFTMLTRLLAAEGPGAAIYEDGQGRVVFHSRHYRLLTARSNTSQATLGHASEPRHAPPFTHDPGRRGVANAAQMAVKSIAYAADAQAYLHPSTVTVPANGSWSITVAFDAPFRDPVWVVQQTGFTPAEYALVTEIPTTYATRSTLTIVNGVGRDFLIDNLYLTTEAGTITEYAVANTIDASASIARYGTRTAAWEPWPFVAQDDAIDLCDAVVSAYQEPRAAVAVTVKNGNTTRLTQQLAREISDRITVIEQQTGFSGPVYIERIRHEVTEGGRFHTTRFDCEEIGAYGETLVFDLGSFDTGRFGF